MLIPENQRQRLLIFNLRTDADDHILGFTTRWINELAHYYSYVDILTTHAGRIAVADNVRVFSTGRERDNSRLARIANFYGHLSRLLLQHHYDACFAHMQPLFAAMGAPLLTLRGVKTTTWYTHRQRNKQVEWATRLSYRVVSAVESSFPVPTPKLRALGHGIDTDFYHPTPHPTVSNRIVQVARLTDIKHQHILLQAAKNLDCEIVLVGDIPDGFGDGYKQRLHAMVDELGIRDKVIFAGAQTPAQVVEWYQGAAIAINLSPIGLFDKAALEGMACGVPVITSNPEFSPLNGHYDERLRISAPDATDELQQKLDYLLNLSPDKSQTIGIHLREGVIEHHSLTKLVEKLITVMHTGELPTPN